MRIIKNEVGIRRMKKAKKKDLIKLIEHLEYDRDRWKEKFEARWFWDYHINDHEERKIRRYADKLWRRVYGIKKRET